MIMIRDKLPFVKINGKLNLIVSFFFILKNRHPWPLGNILTAFSAESRRSNELEESISRGMIQAYDHCTTDLSILNKEDQLKMRLCSSVRAWALTGSCDRSKFGMFER